MRTKTELEWSYQPTDFFEVPTTVHLANGSLTADAGKAVYTLALPTDPLPPPLQGSITEEVSVVFELRQLITHRAFTLEGPCIVQHELGGARSITPRGVELIVVAGGRADVIVKDAAGNVVADTKRDRIESETQFVSSLTPKAMKSSTLRAMVKSFGQAVRDSNDELVHLYEVLDAAAKHYGNESAAYSALGITKADWKRIKRLANKEPLRQGRHRGRYLPGLRDAEPQELAAARSVARRIIEAFAAKI